MTKLPMTALFLTFALIASGCTPAGKRPSPPPVCPQVSPPPAALMKAPGTLKAVSAELLEQPERATPK